MKTHDDVRREAREAAVDRKARRLARDEAFQLILIPGADVVNEPLTNAERLTLWHQRAAVPLEMRMRQGRSFTRSELVDLYEWSNV